MNQNKTEGFGPLGFIWGRDAGGGSPMGFSGWSPPNAVMYVPVVAWDVRHEHAKSHGEWMGLRDILITTTIIMIPYRQVSLLSFIHY